MIKKYKNYLETDLKLLRDRFNKYVDKTYTLNAIRNC